ncbi:MAG: hypothetical protein JSW62_02745, partial [Thermoplasmatales archaeon]
MRKIRLFVLSVLFMIIVLGIFFIGNFSANREFIIKNTAPFVPTNPDPHYYTTGLDVVLQWTGGDPDPGDILTYDVFFGTTSPPPKVAGNQTATQYIPLHLEYGKTYYWRIISRDNHGAVTMGYLWQFTTEEKVNNPPFVPTNPDPHSYTTGLDVVLQWTGGDPDPGDILTYDVFFGTTNPPPKVAGNQTASQYTPQHMEHGKTYYWRIISRDNHGAVTTGYLWQFTTEDKVNNPPFVPTNPDPHSYTTGLDVVLQWTGGDPDPGDI